MELAEMSNISSIEPKKIAILRVFRLMDLVLNFLFALEQLSRVNDKLLLAEIITKFC